MLSRIHVYAASLGLLLAGPAVAVGQSSEAVMLDRASAAATELPSYEVDGLSDHSATSSRSWGRPISRNNRPAPRLRWPACQRLPIRSPC